MRRYYDDCGPRDDREADIWRGICPDCGDAYRPCHCQVPDHPPEPPTEEPHNDTTTDDIPF